MIKVYKEEHGKGVKFEPPTNFTYSTATSIINEMSLYNLIESVESYINMLTSYDSLFAKKCCLSWAVLKSLKIIDVKEAIANKEMTQKMVRQRSRNFVKYVTSTSKVQYLVLRTYFYLKFITSGFPACVKIAIQMMKCW